ncbi:MAG: metallophosphoesterase [Cyclobacteriaceae bacterium]
MNKPTGRVLVMGDIHGNLRAFDQCIEKCEFNVEMDTLIQLGDVSDRLPDTALVIEKLLSFKNLTAIRGNHDHWVNKWLSEGVEDSTWLANGGQDTIDSYKKEADKIDLDAHKTFFSEKQTNFHVDDHNRIFVHGGFTQSGGPDYDMIEDLCLWDRSLWDDAIQGRKLDQKSHVLSGFHEIFIGHTPTIYLFEEEPVNIFNVWNLDTGAGHPTGRLTIMDVSTKEFWQSDLTEDLY